MRLPMQFIRLLTTFITVMLGVHLLSSCGGKRSSKSSSSGGASSGASEIEVSGSISDEESLDFVQSSQSVSIGGVNLTSATSYFVTAYSLEHGGFKKLIFEGSFAEPKFSFKSSVARQYLVIEITRLPDGGQFGAVLPPPTSNKKASLIVDGATTIAAKMASLIASKAASGDQGAREALSSGSVSVADLLMVSQSVRTTVMEQKAQGKGSAIDLSSLTANLISKSNERILKLNAEGQSSKAVAEKLSDSSYQTIFGDDAKVAPAGVLAYRVNPDLGSSEAAKTTVAYEAIKASVSDSTKAVDEAFRAEATAYRNATSAAAAVAATTTVASAFKEVFSSCVSSPPSCAQDSYTPPPPQSSAVEPVKAPGAPTGVIGTAGDMHVELSWTAPADTGGSAITDYVIEYSSNSGSTWVTFSDNTSTSTSASVTGLTNGTSYVFKVAAKNSAGTGNYSGSPSVTPATIRTGPPPPPTIPVPIITRVEPEMYSGAMGAPLYRFHVATFGSDATAAVASIVSDEWQYDESGDWVTFQASSPMRDGNEFYGYDYANAHYGSFGPFRVRVRVTTAAGVSEWSVPFNVPLTYTPYGTLLNETCSGDPDYQCCNSMADGAGGSSVSCGGTDSYGTYPPMADGLGGDPYVVTDPLSADNGKTVLPFYAPYDWGGSPSTRFHRVTYNSTDSPAATTVVQWAWDAPTPAVSLGCGDWEFSIEAISAGGANHPWATGLSVALPPPKATERSSGLDNGVPYVALGDPDLVCGNPTLEYRVQYSADSGATWSEEIVLPYAGNAGGRYFFENLPAVPHVFRVAWVNAVGVGPYSDPTASVTPTASITAEYLIVAGGGGMGAADGKPAGGGAGGLLQGTRAISAGVAMTVTVGAGGTRAQNGQNSVFGGLTAIGGGRGGVAGTPGATGGSGGGGQFNVGGGGTDGQGHSGGWGVGNGSTCGGGGGAGGAGQNGYYYYYDGWEYHEGDGVGGPGLSVSITGNAVVYAAGGSSDLYTPAPAQNTGGGGQYNTGYAGRNGIVVLAYQGPPLASISAGLTYTMDTTSRPGYRVYTFTGGTGTITP